MNHQIGAIGEALAATHLESLGYQVVARNWRHRTGELDIVALHRNTVVAVEVKTRRGSGYGSPLEAITRTKAHRLKQLLHEWVRSEKPRARLLRVDAIGIILTDDERPRIDHLEGIR